MQLPDDIAAKAVSTSEAGSGPRSAEHSLTPGDGHFRVVFDLAPTPLALIDTNGRYLHLNPAFCHLLGYSPAELAGCDIQSIIHRADLALGEELLTRFHAAIPRELRMDARYVHRSSREIWVIANFTPAHDAAGKLLYYVSHVQDVTKQRYAEWLEIDRLGVLEMVAQDKPLPQVLVELGKLIERQIPGVRAGVMLLQDGTIRLFTPNLPGALRNAIGRRPVSFSSGLAAGESDGSSPRVADVETDPAWEGLRGEAREAGVAACWATALRGSDTMPLGFLVVFSPERRPPTPPEMTVLDAALRLVMIGIEHHLTTRQLAHLLHHDALTGLPNRILFQDRLEQAITASKRTGASIALLAMDLNRFKHINDTLGHHAGDALLQQFAHRLSANMRESDTLARMGGDEFILIARNIRGRDEAEMIAARMRETLAAAPFDLAGKLVPIAASIGVAVYPDDAADAVVLQQAADAAMYRVKDAGRHPKQSNFQQAATSVP